MPTYKTYGAVVRDVLEEMVSAVEAGEAAIAAIPPGSTGTCGTRGGGNGTAGTDASTAGASGCDTIGIDAGNKANTTTGTTTVAKGISLAKQTKAKYNVGDVAPRGLGLKVTIPITVDGAGKLGINIGRRTSDSAVYVVAVSKSVLDDCRYLRPGDLLAMAPTSASGTPEPSPFVVGANAARTTYEYYSFEQFQNYCVTSIRPLRFTAVRCILPIRIDQPGSLGFAVEEYVPKNGDTKKIFTRVASVDASHAQSSQIQVGDLICRYGSRGQFSIPRDSFNKLSSCRPLCFDMEARTLPRFGAIRVFYRAPEFLRRANRPFRPLSIVGRDTHEMYWSVSGPI